mmetsp:Transcript_8139/g.17443  ORF Transcript_8139/g.17443 Transcript_8139/m.17443 type:complete len:142 (+) Transcript_8139:209-634(+)
MVYLLANGAACISARNGPDMDSSSIKHVCDPCTNMGIMPQLLMVHPCAYAQAQHTISSKLLVHPPPTAPVHMGPCYFPPDPHHTNTPPTSTLLILTADSNQPSIMRRPEAIRPMAPPPGPGTPRLTGPGVLPWGSVMPSCT